MYHLWLYARWTGFAGAILYNYKLLTQALVMALESWKGQVLQQLNDPKGKDRSTDAITGRHWHILMEYSYSYVQIRLEMCVSLIGVFKIGLSVSIS